MKPVLECKFDYKGYPCVVLFIPGAYRCGYTVYPKPYEPDCIKLPETLEEYFELYEKGRMKKR